MNLDTGIVNMDKQTTRKGTCIKLTPEFLDKNVLDCSDSHQIKRKKTNLFFNMNKLGARDEKMYRVGEWYNNCKNEEENGAKRKFIEYEKLFKQSKNIWYFIRIGWLVNYWFLNFVYFLNTLEIVFINKDIKKL